MSSSKLGSRFWTLWSAATATNLGDGLGLVAFPLLAINLTDDARLVALVSVARFLPFVVLGLPAGVLLDRSDRRRLAVLAQILRAASILGLSIVIMTDRAGMGLLLFSAAMVGVGEVLTDGGLPAIVRTLVRSDQLELANSRLATTQIVTNNFIGPPLGALLFQLDPSVPFLITVVMFVVGAGLLQRLPGTFSPQSAPDSNGPEPFLKAVTVGLKYVWAHPVLRPLALTVALFSFVGEAGNSIFVLVATERFGLSEVEFGALISVDAIAAVIMSLFVARLVIRTSHAFSMRLSIITYAIAALFFGFSTALAGAIFASLMIGISDPSWNVVSGTIRQRLVPDEVFGRMMTAYLFIAWGLQPIGALMGGFVAQAWGPQWVFVISGLAVGSLLVLAQPLFTQLKTAMAPPKPSTPS